MPPGTGLESPAPVTSAMDRKAWLARVEVHDASVQSAIEDNLTANLLEYLREGNHFRDVDLLTGKIGADDLVLRFRFDRYRQTRSPHPAYFPAAIATLTLYIWFGGPIFTDSSDLSGSLSVENASGSSMVKVEAQINEDRNVSIWSQEYVFPSGLKARSAFIRDLLDQAIAQLQRDRKGGKRP